LPDDLIIIVFLANEQKRFSTPNLEVFSAPTRTQAIFRDDFLDLPTYTHQT
jgi:hypothetical protein